MFWKKKKISKSVNKLDKILTWVIVWTAVASMVGLSKTNRWKRFFNSVKSSFSNVFKTSFSFLGKSVVSIVNFFNKK